MERKRMLRRAEWTAAFLLLAAAGCGASDSATPPPGAPEATPNLTVDPGAAATTTEPATESNP